MEDKSKLVEEIEKLKKQKDAIILAHYYVDGQLQDIADYVGDSYGLAKKAVESDKKRIIFCGVKFMGESAKILNPDKKVYLVEKSALCPMAADISGEVIKQYREKYKDLCVVTYVNSTAESKARSDVCVTSSNAVKIVSQIKAKNILLCPDRNLGTFIKIELKDRLKDRNVILYDSSCPVHDSLTPADLKKMKKDHPKAPVFIHPEVNPACYELADYIGSTAGIVKEVQKSDADEFIIGTEKGISHKLMKENPNKKFYFTGKVQFCRDMKKLNLEKLRDCLRDDLNEVVLDQEIIEKAGLPLKRMMEMAAN